MNHPQATPPLAVVFWAIWFAILSGLLMMQFVLGGAGEGEPGSTEDQGSMLFQIIGLTMAAATVFVRFGVIPRLDGLKKKLPAMIVGLALAEGIGILGLFAVPREQAAARLFMLSLSIVCIVLSAPVYAKVPRSGSPFRDGTP